MHATEVIATSIACFSLINMNKGLLLLLTSLCISISQASSLSKRYVTFSTESGILYFIRPMHMPKCDGNTSRYGMTFDITYLSGDLDSVSFTSTIVIRELEEIDSVYIRYGREVLKSKVERIYCEPYKSGYVYRSRFYIKWSELKQLYKNDEPYLIEYRKNIRFSFRKKKWRKEHKEINQIINLIDYNQLK